MGKFDEAIIAAKEAKEAKPLELARKGPNMADNISSTGRSVLDGDLMRIREQAASSVRAKFAKAPGALAAVVGGGAGEAAPSVGAGSSAGLVNEKSAVIRLNNTGYDNAAQMIPNQPARGAISVAEDFVKMRPQTIARNVTDYRKATSTGARLLANRFI